MSLNRIVKCAVAGLAALILAGPGAAQGILTTDQLFQNAHAAWNSRDYVRTFGFLEAYIQRDPPAMRDGGFRSEVAHWRSVALDNARNPTQTASSGSGSSGSGIGSTQQGLTYRPPSAEPARPRSYLMRCVGGGPMSANYYPRGNSHSLMIWFDHAPRRATTSRPPPGSCAWMDRPIASAEPNWMQWDFDSRVTSIDRIMFGSSAGNRGLGLEPNPVTPTSGLIMEVNGPMLTGLIRSIHRGRLFEVECYNDGNGRFIVTRVVRVGG